MSSSPLPGPPRARTIPVGTAQASSKDEVFSSFTDYFPFTASHKVHPHLRRVQALERIKINGAIGIFRVLTGYVGLWRVLMTVVAFLLGDAIAWCLDCAVIVLPILNFIDAFWTLKQVYLTRPGSNTPSGVAHSPIRTRVHSLGGRAPITPRFNPANAFGYPPSPLSTPALRYATPMRASSPNSSFGLSNSSPSLHAARTRNAALASQLPPPPNFAVTPSPSHRSKTYDDTLSPGPSPFTSSILGNNMSRPFGRALDASTLHQLGK